MKAAFGTWHQYIADDEFQSEREASFRNHGIKAELDRRFGSVIFAPGLLAYTYLLDRVCGVANQDWSATRPY